MKTSASSRVNIVIDKDLIETTTEFERVFATSFFNKIYPTEVTEFFEDAGKEHHRLLSYLTTFIEDGVIVDVLTQRGQNALALSYNPSNTVHTFDTTSKMTDEQKQSKWQSRKIEYHQDNLWNANTRKKWRETLLSASLIFVDFDPHDGYLEYELYAWLKKNKFKGLLVYDDIYFDGMKENFWKKVPDSDKLDASPVGHFTGTGIIRFPDYCVFDVTLRLSSSD